jgi:hypothetical protein
MCAIESTGFTRTALPDDPNIEMELAERPADDDGPASGGDALFPEIPTWADEQFVVARRRGTVVVHNQNGGHGSPLEARAPTGAVDADPADGSLPDRQRTPPGHQPDRLVPRRLAELGLALPAAADHRPGQAVVAVVGDPGVEALGPEAADGATG